MTAKIIVIGPKDRNRAPKGATVINTTSKSATNIGSQLSPFLLGPCKLWGNLSAKNMENGWQYSKVYSQHTDGKKIDMPNWLSWAKAGWKNPKAVRYPMGRGAAPEFSYWDGKQYGYIEARARIYIPLYARAVRKTDSFKTLKKMYKEEDEIFLWDFDGYDREAVGSTLTQVLTDPRRKMGHAFVLAMMLEWGDRFYLD